MIQLLFALIFMEMVLIVVFLFKTPVRKLVVMCLDRVKRGRGPIVVKTVAGTIFMVMMATLYNMVAIQKSWVQDTEINPTDQILLAKHLLEASLMGFSLFLALVIDRLHHYIYIRELRMRRKSMEALKKQKGVVEDGNAPFSEEIKALGEEKSKLHERIKQLETQLEDKVNERSQCSSVEEAIRRISSG